ncbi:MAG: hypothetical protein AB7S38_14870 [Vulcanimicrobiota bacterium]
MKRHHAGNTLLGVILFTLVMATLIFTLTAGMTTQLQVTTAEANRAQASLCADSVIYQAIGELKADADFAGELHYAPSREALGTLTFAEGDAPYSTNNVRSAGSRSGFNRALVPAKTVHLVAVGRCNNKTVVREAYIHFPPFPYSLAAAGPLNGSNLEVFSVDSLAALEDGLDEDDRRPGNLVTNGSAVLSDSEVLGDAQAVGSITLTRSTAGRVLANHAPEELPSVSAGQFDPRALDYAYAYQGDSEVSGRCYNLGSLSLGDLALDDGLLWVDGDLTINGDITGHGAIVCTGNVVVRGSMRTESAMTALVADGDVTIQGEGRVSSRFQGLVYSGGRFAASDVTVVGAVVSKETTRPMELRDVRMVLAPELTEMEVVSQVMIGEDDHTQSGIVGIVIPSVPLSLFPVEPGSMRGDAATYVLDESLLNIQYQGVLYRRAQDLPLTQRLRGQQELARVRAIFLSQLAQHTPGDATQIDVFSLSLNRTDRYAQMLDGSAVLTWKGTN